MLLSLVLLCQSIITSATTSLIAVSISKTIRYSILALSHCCERLAAKHLIDFLIHYWTLSSSMNAWKELALGNQGHPHSGYCNASTWQNYYGNAGTWQNGSNGKWWDLQDGAFVGHFVKQVKPVESGYVFAIRYYIPVLRTFDSSTIDILYVDESREIRLLMNYCCEIGLYMAGCSVASGAKTDIRTIFTQVCIALRESDDAIAKRDTATINALFEIMKSS